MGIAEEFGMGAPLVLKGTVAGVEKELSLQLGLFNLTVMAGFASWAQDVVIERTRKLAGAMPEEVRHAAICRAVDIIAKEADWGGPVCESLQRSPVGIAKLIHLLLSPEDRRAIKIESIMELIDPDQSEQIQYALFKAARVSDAKIAEILAGSKEKNQNPTEAATTRESQPSGRR